VYLSLLTSVHIYLLITRSKARHLKPNTLFAVAVSLVLVSLVGSVVPFATDHYGRLGKRHTYIHRLG
jgi:hypothetical protein